MGFGEVHACLRDVCTVYVCKPVRALVCWFQLTLLGFPLGPLISALLVLTTSSDGCSCSRS
jgi:hypothetical protein